MHEVGAAVEEAITAPSPPEFSTSPYKSAQSVVFAGCARNVEQPLRQTVIANIEHCGAEFGQYRVAILEEGSTDGSREVLRRWAGRNFRVRPMFRPTALGVRTERLAACRNELLGAALSPWVERQGRTMSSLAFDFLVMLDLDYTWPLQVDREHSCLHKLASHRRPLHERSPLHCVTRWCCCVENLIGVCCPPTRSSITMTSGRCEVPLCWG